MLTDMNMVCETFVLERQLFGLITVDCMFELKIRKSSNIAQELGGIKRSRPLDCSQGPDQGLAFYLGPFAKRQRSAT